MTGMIAARWASSCAWRLFALAITLTAIALGLCSQLPGASALAAKGEAPKVTVQPHSTAVVVGQRNAGSHFVLVGVGMARLVTQDRRRWVVDHLRNLHAAGSWPSEFAAAGKGQPE